MKHSTTLSVSCRIRGPCGPPALWPPAELLGAACGALRLFLPGAGLGSVEWEVQSSRTGCGDPPSLPGHRTTTTELTAAARVHIWSPPEPTGAHRSPQERVVAAGSRSVSRFVSGRGSDPGESPGAGSAHFGSVRESHHYTRFSHRSLRSFFCLLSLHFS